MLVLFRWSAGDVAPCTACKAATHLDEWPAGRKMASADVSLPSCVDHVGFQNYSSALLQRKRRPRRRDLDVRKAACFCSYTVASSCET